jgi:2,4-dienoyl-CoA reductase-like NADH-dependent reductase (Old Yellow Enzyme family)
MRFPLWLTEAVGDISPADRSLFVGVSATGRVRGGLTSHDIVAMARELREQGMYASSGCYVTDWPHAWTALPTSAVRGRNRSSAAPLRPIW